MALGTVIAGVDVSVTDTTQKWNLGTKVRGFNGTDYAEYVYILAGAELAQGKCYSIGTGFTVTSGVTASVGLGTYTCFPQATIASGEYGWALVDGGGYIYVASATSAATQLYTSGTAGVLDINPTSQKKIEGIVTIKTQATAAGATTGVVVGPAKMPTS